jgi:hypothetical protein
MPPLLFVFMYMRDHLELIAQGIRRFAFLLTSPKKFGEPERDLTLFFSQ